MEWIGLTILNDPTNIEEAIKVRGRVPRNLASTPVGPASHVNHQHASFSLHSKSGNILVEEQGSSPEQSFQAYQQSMNMASIVRLCRLGLDSCCHLPTPTRDSVLLTGLWQG